MASNKVQVTLGFNADTTQALQAIQRLNKELNNIQNIKLTNLGINQELNAAADAAKTLLTALLAAFNLNTGLIDMSRFAQLLKLAGTDVSTLSANLARAGLAGTVAFTQVARAVSLMDVPIKQTNKTLQTMLTTLKNTAKWEMSSAAIHGLESAFSNALGYVRDLNEALTDIRVVSGLSVSLMAAFAEQANISAKALGTTTKEYAKAALTYYQLGDSAEMAAKKAEITLKATNVAFKATASEMSEMLTSTWNGFLAGADELEHYVDVMANLGSHTASSVEEIATALLKVAATAKTVGVSMEQMSAMIATVSSATRLSAEVVGTSMNTILSRFSSLKLGETLEDGLDLTKYTKALAAIGVNVLDINGELRDMGSVVDDIMNKWQTLSDGQKVALAQTVGGVRQYTNMMALFNNLTKYLENMQYAQNADGALLQMEDIYLSGIEGKSKQLKASLEGIWQDIIDDQAIVKGTEALTKLVDGIHNMINSLGGLGGIAASVGGILVSVFSKNIAASLTNATLKVLLFKQSISSQEFKDNGIIGKLGMLTKQSMNQRLYDQLNQAFIDELATIRSGNQNSVGLNLQLQATQILLEKKLQLVLVESSLSDAERAGAQAQLAALLEEANLLTAIGLLYDQNTQLVQRLALDLLAASDAALTYTERITNIKTRTANVKKEYSSGIQDTTTGAYTEVNSLGGLFATELDLTNVDVDLMIERAQILGTAFETVSAAAGQLSNINIGDTFEQALPHILATIVSLEGLREHFKALGTQDGTEAANKILSIIEKLKNISSDNFATTFPSVFSELQDLMASTGRSADLLFTVLEHAGVPKAAIDALRNSIGEMSDSIISSALAGNTFEQMANKIALKASLMQTKFEEVSKGVGTAVSGLSTMYYMTANWDTSNFAVKATQITMSVKSLANSLFTIIKPGAINKIIGGIGLVAQASGLIAGLIERNKKQLEERAKDAREIANKSSSETLQEINDTLTLINTYNELYNKYQDTGEVTDELIDSAKKLAETYDIQGVSVLSLKENIDGFNESLSNSLSLSKELKQARINVQNNRSAFVSTYNSEQGKRKNITQASASEIESAIKSDLTYTYSADENFIPVLGKNISDDKKRALFENWFSNYIDSVIFDNNDQVLELDADDLNDIYAKIQTFFNLTDDELKEYTNLFSNVEDFQASGYYSLNNIDKDLYNKMFNAFYEATSQDFISMINNRNKTSIINQYNNGVYGFIDTEVIEQEFAANNEKFTTVYQDLYLKAIDAQNILLDPNMGPLEQANAIADYVEIYTDILSQMGTFDKDSLAYKILNRLAEQVGSIANNEDLVKSALQFIESSNIQGKLEIFDQYKTQISGKTLKTIGTDGGFKGLSQLWSNIASTVTDSREQFDSLSGLEVNTQEYNKAVDEIVAEILKEWGAIDDSIDLFKYLKNNFEDNDLDQIIGFMSSKDITDLSGISKYLSTIKYILNLGQSLNNNPLLNRIAEVANADTEYNETMSKVNQMQTNEATLKKNMTMEDLNALYETYWENGPTDIVAWEDFITLDYDAREAYIKSITLDYITASKTAADLLINEEKQYQTQLINSFNTKYGVQARGQYFLQLYDKYLLAKQSITQDENGKYKYADQLYNTEEEAYLAAGITNLERFKNYELIAPQITESKTKIAKAEKWIKLLLGFGEAADSSATKISKLASAMNSLPTSVSELDNLVKILNENGQTNITAKSLLAMSDSEREAAIISAMEAELEKIDENSTGYALKEAELDQAKKTHAANEITRNIRDETEELSRLKTAYSSLSSIDISKIPKSGTLAYQTLNQALKNVNSSIDEFTKKNKQGQIELIGKAQRQNLLQLIAQQTSIASLYGQGYTFTQDLTSWADDVEYSAWQKWYAAQQEIINLKNQIDETYSNELKAKMDVLNEEADNIEKRLLKAQKEADELLNLAQIFTKAVESGELSATDTVKLDESDILTWNTLTTAEERAAFAAKLWSEAIISAKQAQETTLELLTSAQTSLSLHKFTSRSNTFENETDFSNWLLNGSGITNALVLSLIQKAYKALSDEGYTFTNNADTIDAIKAKLKSMKDEGELAYQLIEAAGIDAMTSIYESMAESSANAAKAEIERWRNTFLSIANLRAAILGGSTSALSSEDWLQGYIQYKQNNSSATPESYTSGLRNGSIGIDNFNYQTLTPDMILSQYGLTSSLLLFNGVGNHLTANVARNIYKNTPGLSYDDAVKLAEAQVKTGINTLINNFPLIFGNVSEDAINNFVQGKSASINGIDIVSTLNNLVEAQQYDANVRQPALQTVSEAEIARDKTLEQAEIDAAKAEKYNVQIQEYRDAALALIDGMGDETIEASLENFKGTASDFLKKFNEQMGTTYTNIADISKTALLDFMNSNGMALDFDEPIRIAKEKVNAQNDYITALESSGTADQSTIDAAKQTLEEYQQELEEATNAKNKFIDTDMQTYLETLAKDIDLSAKELQDYTNELIKNGDISSNITQKEALKYAKAIRRQYEGFKTAKENLKSYTKELKASLKDYNRHATALQKMRDMYADVFDFDANQAKRLSQAFLESADNAKELEKAAKGDEDAYNRLLAAAAKDITIDVDTNMAKASFNALIDEIANYDFLDIEIGAELNDTPFYNALSQMVVASAQTADDVSAALSTIGVDATLVPHEVPIAEGKAQITPSGDLQVPEIGPDGKVRYRTVGPTGSYTLSADGGTATYWTIEGAKYNGKGVTRGGSSKSSGGGGGGGGNKTKDKKTDSDKERYHQINRSIAKQNSLMDLNEKLKSRKYGADYEEALIKENKQLEKQIALNKQKYTEAERYAEHDRAELESYGATFDTEGNLNYEAYMDSWNAWYNQKADDFANGLINEDKWDEEVEDVYEKAMEALENYEEAEDIKMELINDNLDKENQILANNFENITYKVNLKLELNDNDLQRLNYMLKMTEEYYDRQGDAFKYIGDQIGDGVKDLESYITGLDELNEKHAAGLISDKDYGELSLQYSNDIWSKLSEVEDKMRELRAQYGVALEKANEELEKHTLIMTHAADVGSSYITILGLMGHKLPYSDLEAFYNMQYQANLNNLSVQRQQLDYYESELKYYEDKIAAGQTLSETEQKQYEDLQAIYIETHNSFLSNAQKTLEGLKTMYDESINEIWDNLSKVNAAGHNNINDMAEAYGYWQEQQLQYLATGRQLYEVSKLNRDIEGSIADATTKASKLRLAALLQVINAKSEEGKLTEYNIEMYELQYKMALAMLELEDARNAKSTVRLVRDASGNYGYQYTADADKLDEAEQNYEEVLEQIRKLTEEYADQMAEGMINARTKLEEELRNLKREDFASDEEYMQKRRELVEFYTGQMQYYADQYAEVTQDLATNLQYIGNHYHMSQEELMTATKEMYNEDVLALVEGQLEYETKLKESLDEADSKWDWYTEEIKTVENTTKLSYDNMTNSVKDYNAAVEAAEKEGEKVIETSKAVTELIHKETAAWEANAAAILAVIDKSAAYAEKAHKDVEELANGEDNTDNNGAGTDDTPSTPDTFEAKWVQEGEKWKYQIGENEYVKDDWKEINGKWYHFDDKGFMLIGWFQDKDKWYYLGPDGAMVTGNYDINGVMHGFDSEGVWTGEIKDNSGQSGTNGYKVTYTVTGFGEHNTQVTKTGFGKGDTESAARSAAESLAAEKMAGLGQPRVSYGNAVAYLHGGLIDFTGPAWVDGTQQDPELVLNASDTPNLLAAVQVVRTLSPFILSQLASNAAGMLYSDLYTPGVGSTAQQLEQIVQITAEFPNATDHNEIEAAFNDLINQTAQYINRK